MKKRYIKPEQTVMLLSSSQSLLAGSVTALDNNTSNALDDFEGWGGVENVDPGNVIWAD